MKSFLKSGLAAATVAVTCLGSVATVQAGGLYNPGGSMKDVPQLRGSVSRCYVRGDIAYSVSGSTTVELDSPNYPAVDTDSEDMDNAVMGEVGIGCGSGSRGFRGDLTFGYYSDRDIDGIKTDRPGVHYPGTFETKVSSLTAMANVYYDMGKFRGFVPYVGVGIGVARHRLGSVSFDLRNPDPLGPPANPVNNLEGSTQTNFAWSLMAGAAYQISERAVLDFGYRYIDLGDVESRRGNMCITCVAGGSQDRLTVDDITAHEFKVGLRLHFGGRSQPSYK
ncbi:MAG: outer membrane protein [Hyphomicrobiaceae bacterium]